MIRSQFEEQHNINDLRNKIDNGGSSNARVSYGRGGDIYSQTGVLKDSENRLRVKADYKPEIFFIGQIVGGTDFPTELDGLFVEASLKYGENWKMFEKIPAIQSHTAYCDEDGFFVWAHPFDFHFSCESVQGW